MSAASLLSAARSETYILEIFQGCITVYLSRYKQGADWIVLLVESLLS
jgi:hypothetical protein